MQGLLENFSENYVLAPTIEVNRHPGDEAMLDADAYRIFARLLGEPVVGFTGGLHYEFRPSRQVLGGRAAVPSRNHTTDDQMALLLAK